MKEYLYPVILVALYLLWNRSVTEPFTGSIDGGSYELPRIAWTHWNNDRPPKVIKDILENRASAMPGWDIRFVTDETVLEYIPQEDFPLKYKGLSPPHRADWLRLRLLELHGGVWLDAGIIVNDGASLDKLRDETISSYRDGNLT